MFIPEEARYDYLLNLPAQADTGRAVNIAMDAIAKLNPSLAGVLPNTYTELGNDLFASVIRIFNNPASMRKAMISSDVSTSTSWGSSHPPWQVMTACSSRRNRSCA